MMKQKNQYMVISGTDKKIEFVVKKETKKNSIIVCIKEEKKI